MIFGGEQLGEVEGTALVHGVDGLIVDWGGHIGDNVVDLLGVVELHSSLLGSGDWLV